MVILGIKLVFSVCDAFSIFKLARSVNIDAKKKFSLQMRTDMVKIFCVGHFGL